MTITVIGKEANRIDDVRAGIVADPADITTVYDDGTHAHFRRHILPALDHYSGRRLAQVSGVDRRTIDRIRQGQMPRPALRRRLTDLARVLTRPAEQITFSGPAGPVTIDLTDEQALRRAPGHDNVLVCEKCGHTEWWEDGNYMGERKNFKDHVCSSTQREIAAADWLT